MGDRPSRVPSDSFLVRSFREGNEAAATQIYQRYAGRLRALARARCSSDLAPRLDAEDVVQSVFQTFFQAARAGLYDVPEEEDLWKLLVVLTVNKVRAQGAYHRAAKRDVRVTTALNPGSLEGQESRSRSPFQGFAWVMVGEALEQLPLPDRQMVELRMQGYEVAEIAARTGRSKRTVERILQAARHRLHLLLNGEE